MPANNYALAFLEFCKGTPIPEISQILGIPEETLKRQMIDGKWNTLKRDLPMHLPDEVPAVAGNGEPRNKNELQAKALLLQKNREENYAQWCKLREDASKVVSDLLEGRLRFKKYWHNKGQIVEHDCEPSMAERVSLANYLMMVTQGTYAALGDRAAASGANERGDTNGQAAQAPAITLVLPNVVSVPRDMRQAQGHVVELQAVEAITADPGK